MNLSRLFIQRPVATTLVMIAIFLCGLVSWKFLPVASLPEVDYPTMQVTTLYRGLVLRLLPQRLPLHLNVSLGRCQV